MKTAKGAEVQKGAEMGAAHPAGGDRCRGASPYIGGAAPCTSPASVRILLSARASEHLTATGEQCFAVIGRASYPDSPQRMVLHLVPCSVDHANKAVAVAKGKLHTRKPPRKKGHET